MKYVDEFRSSEKVRLVAAAITSEVKPSRTYRFMEFCGGHTHAIYRYGLPSLFPCNLTLVHGPGCPVCVLPMLRIEAGIRIATKPNVIFCTFGDMIRVPALHGRSLLKARAAGADVRMIYSPLDVLELAQANPEKKVVFFAVGFETTTPMTASLIKRAADLHTKNLYVFCNHVLTPPAVTVILQGAEHTAKTARGHQRKGSTSPVLGPDIDGIIGPGHVSTIVGVDSYEGVVAKYQKPIVVSGFEPLDIMQSVLMLVRQVNAMDQDAPAKVENQYSRSATHQGNDLARAMVSEVFELRSTFEWRGLGFIPHSGLKIKNFYQSFDAEEEFKDVFDATLVSSLNSEFPESPKSIDATLCRCGDILRGLMKPSDCPLFGKACTPDDPVGACMVSSEGACAAYWTYGGV